MFLIFGWFAMNLLIITQIVVIIFISPLIPDLDHQSGKLHQLLLGISLFIAVIGFGCYVFLNNTSQWLTMALFGVLLAFTTFFVGYFTNHRGFMHSISFCGLYSGLVFMVVGFNIQIAVLSFVGCYTHLVADKVPLKLK